MAGELQIKIVKPIYCTLAIVVYEKAVSLSAAYQAIHKLYHSNGISLLHLPTF